MSSGKIKAGNAITVTGSINPGQELYVVVATEKMFKPRDAIGPKEKKELRDGKGGKNAFGDTAIPPVYYVVTSDPTTLATPKSSTKGQTSGIFAFPPFKYEVKVNKLKAWADIPEEVKSYLGPIKDEAQWKFIAFTHENKFGINTISKEAPIGGGNARCVMTDYNTEKKPGIRERASL